MIAVKTTVAAALLALLHPGPPPVDEGAVRAAVARLTADVKVLASDEMKGRRAGTPEADAAAKWVAESFRKAGLLPGGTAGSYLQTFDFIAGVTLGPKNALATTTTSPLGHRWSAGTDFTPLAFSSAGTVQGSVVFAGYGIVSKELGYDDYAGLDVKDKVVLALRFGPDGDDSKSAFSAYMPLRLKVSLAKERGARALLVITGPATKDVPDDLVAMRTDFSFSDAGLVAMSVKRPVAEHLFEGSGKTLEEAQKAIDQEKKPHPFALASAAALTADVSPKREKTSNVIGLLPGGDASMNQEFVVFGAHYDHLGLGGPGSLEQPAAPGAAETPSLHIHHGADDNASGVAALLELARRLVVKRSRLGRSSLFIAFGAEEEGSLGSTHFTKEPTVPLEKVVAMVNLDMVGRLREDALDVHGVGTAAVWKPLVEKANAETKLALKLHEGGFGPSDHSSFTAAQKPVLFLFTGNHPDYHKPSDTAEKLSYEGIDRLLRFLQPIAESVLSAAERPVYTAVASDKRPNAPGPASIRAWAGTIPDYSGEGNGLPLSGVRPGSPAEKAGLRRGDVMVKFGAREVKNIYDYTYALQDLKPGDTVPVVVKRTENGKSETVELTITLGTSPGGVR